ncbi:Uma2 family endonuclease [Actinomycetospora termitidis]|uniref:Uma2 family endonuclease n=1 Tax=Actinomycetospora termitidis TaxID=3053470 RepID=A0ABT7M800_9PSEU|nr:Uma2 family endonuclease [Actinomycetospora sp. Odt1-22]MDL5156804.1 Uma2 family endonuclease [Actinomycetospora sp. Odt1-22]
MAAPHQEEAPRLLDRTEPWTEQEWLELPEKSPVELVDGALVMSPRGSNQHQRLAYRSFAVLDAAATSSWSVVGEPTVRVGRNRLLMPDVAVIRGDLDPGTVINDAVDVALVVEVVSPGNAAHDRILKPHLYAEAGVRWYLRVEQEGPVGHLHELVDGAYREIATGPVVELTEPFPVTLDLPHLAR